MDTPELPTGSTAGEWVTRVVTVTQPGGFHMRAIARFVHAAGLYPAETLRVSRESEPSQEDGRSPWALLVLGACEGDRLVLRATGPRAAELLDALAATFEASADD